MIAASYTSADYNASLLNRALSVFGVSAVMKARCQEKRPTLSAEEAKYLRRLMADSILTLTWLEAEFAEQERGDA